MCIDDIECKKGLQLLTEEPGWEVMSKRYGVPEESIREMSEIMGISGVCNVLGAHQDREVLPAPGPATSSSPSRPTRWTATTR